MYAWLALIVLTVGIAAERFARPKGGGRVVSSRLACYAGQGACSSLVQIADCALLNARLSRYVGRRPDPNQAPPEDSLTVVTRLTYYVGRQIQ